MLKTASWYRTSATHLTADMDRVGSLMVWQETSTGRWSACGLGRQSTGFASPAEAQAAAVRLARDQLERGLWTLEELERSAMRDRAQAGRRRNALVAEEGFEPPTKGL
jgi:hypothetical protein